MMKLLLLSVLLAGAGAQADLLPPPDKASGEARIAGDDAADFFKALNVKSATKSLAADVNLETKTIRTKAGTTLICTALSDSKGKAIAYFRGYRTSCVFTPAAAAK